jgi:POT family proton-dependent oligopeptide transporter
MAGLQIDDLTASAALAETAKHNPTFAVDTKEHAFDQPHTHSHSQDHLDGRSDGLEEPTEEDFQTLRRVADKIPWTAYLIAIVEMTERFSFYGSSVVFTNFIQQPLPPGSRTGAGFSGQSGALGLGQRASTGLTTFYNFWCYITPLYGAYVADAHLGRFKTINYSIYIAMLGHIILIVSSVPGVIEHKSAAGAFAVALIVMGIGTGGFKANISPLIAEQYRHKKHFVITTSHGERVIVDPSLTISRIYMYFYLFINIGALIGQITMTYAEKYVGFWLAYTLPTAMFCLSPAVLFFGRKRYARAPPSGSVLASSLRIVRYAARGRWSINPIRTWKNFNTPDFWESAKPSRIQGEKPAWMTFDDQWVDEVRRGFKACAVFCWFPLYWLTYNQINNNLTSQAATMNTHGLPNDILSNLDPLALVILIPIMDIIIYPGLRRLGLNFTALKKITGGFLVGALAMMCAAIVQHYIYETNPCHHSAATCQDADGNAVTSDLNVWIQAPSYILIAISEILASITGLEYAFTKAPKNMRSLVMAVFLFMSAISAAIGEAFVSLAADPLLVWNYGSMGVIAAIGGILFWFSVRDLDTHEDELNNLAEGHYDAQEKH